MILNLKIHKYPVMLTQNRRGEKFFPKLTQVINRWISGVLITCCPPVGHQLSHLLYYKRKYMTGRICPIEWPTVKKIPGAQRVAIDTHSRMLLSCR